MTIGELITILAKYDLSAEVAVEEPDGFYVPQIYVCPIQKDLDDPTTGVCLAISSWNIPDYALSDDLLKAEDN